MNKTLIIGERQTKQRNAIITFLRDCETPVTAEEIHYNLILTFGQISPSTVYRNLEKLETAGFVSGIKHGFEGSVRYQLTGKTHVHHFICRSCKKTIPLKVCPLEDFEAQAHSEQFTVEGHSFEIWGSCRECSSLH